MTDEKGHISQTDDNSQTADGAGANVKVSVVGMDKPFFTALAVAISILSAFYAFEAGREAALANYWLSRNEAFLEQLSSQGVHVPPDLLQHKEKRP